eukprot:524395_1
MCYSICRKIKSKIIHHTTKYHGIVNFGVFGHDKKKTTKSNDIEGIGKIHYLDENRKWKSIDFAANCQNIIRINKSCLVIFLTVTVKNKAEYVRMEISPVAITHCCVQCDDNISISMRVIEINKIQKRVNTDNGKSWKKMTSCEQKAVIQFQHNVIWKFEDNLWDQAVVSVLINKHEYMNDVICSIGEILDQPVETDNEEIDARKLLWDKKKKCWLHSHSIINNNMQKEEQKLFGGGTVNCLECSALHTIYKIPDYCINKEYLNIDEFNEISYYLREQYSYGNTW